jgi:ubiquitin-protein ligase
LLYIEMGAEYPMFAPAARFITPIYHPNINRHGRICHSILDRNWTVDTSNSDLINNIYSLLLMPEFSDPINTVVTLNYYGNEVQFKEEAQKHVQKHASKSRAEWREEIVEDI